MSDVRGVESEVDKYVKENMQDAFATGWILVASISSASTDSSNRDDYAILTSEGLPYHAQVGLLKVAQNDKQSVSLLPYVHNVLANFFEEDEDEEEESVEV